MARHARQVASGAGSLPGGAVVIPAERANSLIIAGSPVQLAEIKRIIVLLDVEPSAGHGNFHAIFLDYLDAQDAAESLNKLLAKSLNKEAFRHIGIEASVSRNALLVDAAPANFSIVKDLVSQLDKAPQQVLVEVVIAEVSLGKNLDFGVEWATIEAPRQGRTTFIGRQRSADNLIGNLLTNAFFPQGLNLALARGTFVNAAGVEVPRVPAFIRALAQDRDVKILSNVPLLAQENKEASVSVVENIPVLRSTIEGGSGTARDVIQNIDRVDVGIQVKLTPHVNPNDEIKLELNPTIEAIVDNGPNGQFTPTIAKREVTTTITVPDRSTVMISGLIREDVIDADSKVPLLGDIPILGHLFKTRNDRRQKTNLMILVTPRIVRDMDQAKAIRRSLEEKAGMGEVREKISIPLKEKTE